MPNFLQMYATSNELQAINKMRNGGRRYFEFITIKNLGYISISHNGWHHSCKMALI